MQSKPSKEKTKDAAEKSVESEEPLPKRQHQTNSEEESTSSEDEEPEVEVPADEIVQISFVNSLVYKLLSAEVPVIPASSNRRKRDREHQLEPAPLIEVDLKAEEIYKLCDHAIESLKKQKSLLRISNEHLPLVVCGDIHGQFRELRGIFAKMGLPYTQSYLFLGDYVDRGVQGIEVALFLLALQIKFPTKVFLLRGNHEDRNTTMSYGFYDECVNRFLAEGTDVGEKVFNTFMTTFNYLPLAALVDGVVLCMHGGLSPHMTTVEDIEKIQRPSIIPAYGLLCDLLWSDPVPEEARDGWSLSPRGISFNFGPSIVEEFCKRNKLDLIVRGHQLIDNNGYKFLSHGRVLTIFTAPNYQNQKNDGAILRISKKHKCRLVILRTRRKTKPGKAKEDSSE